VRRRHGGQRGRQRLGQLAAQRALARRQALILRGAAGPAVAVRPARARSAPAASAGLERTERARAPLWQVLRRRSRSVPLPARPPAAPGRSPRTATGPARRAGERAMGRAAFQAAQPSSAAHRDASKRRAAQQGTHVAPRDATEGGGTRLRDAAQHAGGHAGACHRLGQPARVRFAAHAVQDHALQAQRGIIVHVALPRADGGSGSRPAGAGRGRGPRSPAGRGGGPVPRRLLLGRAHSSLSTCCPRLCVRHCQSDQRPADGAGSEGRDTWPAPRGRAAVTHGAARSAAQPGGAAQTRGTHLHHGRGGARERKAVQHEHRGRAQPLGHLRGATLLRAAVPGVVQALRARGAAPVGDACAQMPGAGAGCTATPRRRAHHNALHDAHVGAGRVPVESCEALLLGKHPAIQVH